MKSFFKVVTVAVFSMIVFAAPGFAADTVKVASAGVISGDLARCVQARSCCEHRHQTGI